MTPNNDTTRAPPFFIFGPERSGTTLLAFLLSGQPGLFCINDSFIFKSFIDSVSWSAPGPNNRSVSNLLRILADLVPGLLEEGRPEGWSLHELVYRAQVRRVRNNYPPSYRLSSGEVVKYLDFLAHRYEAGGPDGFLHEYRQTIPSLSTAMRSGNPIPLQSLFSETLKRLSSQFNEAQSEDTIVGEKTPAHTVYWKWILDSLYPQSQGVVVVRHPITNIASILRRTSSLSAAKARYQSFSRAIVDLASHPRVTVIKYEELVGSPSSTIGHVVKAIGGRGFDPSLRLASYAKGAYTGDRIDPSRNPRPDDLFTADERMRIRRRFNRILSAYQYD